MNPTIALALALAACGPAEPVDGGSASWSASLGEEPDFSDPNGRIEVQTWFDQGETQLQGAFADGPRVRWNTEAERVGNCRLMTYAPSQCTPACAGEQACVDGECLSWPARRDLGDLRWVWPDGDQTVSPDGALAYFATGAASEPGDVSIEVGDLSLVAPTIDAPEPDGDWTRALEQRGDGDATLRWKDPILHARVRLFMTDCIATHGGIAAAEIECEGPDSGELVIPGAFLDALDEGDWSQGECGSHDLQRYHSAGDATERLETVAATSLSYRGT
jgi:hypothetical protein